jgi:hypothetical protein
MRDRYAWEIVVVPYLELVAGLTGAGRPAAPDPG